MKMAREHLKRRIVAAGDRVTVDYLAANIERWGAARIVDSPKASQACALFLYGGWWLSDWLHEYAPVRSDRPYNAHVKKVFIPGSRAGS